MLGHLLDSNTLGLWRLNDASGATTFADAVGALSLGIFSQLPTHNATGLIDIARDFDGSQGLVSTANPYASDRAGALTIEAWVKLSSTWSAAGVIAAIAGADTGDLANRCALRLRIDSNRAVTLQYQGDNTGTAVTRSVSTSAGTIPTNTKVHVAGRKRQDGSNWYLEVLVNGVLIITSSAYTDAYLGGTGATLLIGADKDSAGAIRNGFKGTIDDVRLSKVSRADVEVGQSFRRGYDTSAGAVALLTPLVNEISSDEKAALVGTDGTPDGANPFVTDSDPRLNDDRTPVAHTHTQDEVTDFAHAAAHVSGVDQIDDATPSTHGLMSGADKTKLDGITPEDIPTADEKAALEGTGIPSGLNPFVTDDDDRLSDARAPTTHTHTQAEVTDFDHTHTKSEVTDFTHTHTKSEITDFAHTHTVSEVTDFPDEATTGTSGLMSAADKTKLDALAGRYVTTPATATATGEPGDWSVDSEYLYVCTATDTWKRVAIATW